MNRVVLVDEVGDLDAVRAVLATNDDVVAERAGRLPEGADVIALLAGTEVPVGPAQLAALPSLRIVAATSTGYDHLALPEIAAAGAWATHCPGYCDEEVAEHALAFSLDLLRGVTLLDRSMRAGRYDHLDAPGRRVGGAVMGVIGLGRIGRAVAWRAHALGMRVLASDPFAQPCDGVELVALDDLLRAADVITLHALLTEDTRGLIGARELALMRPDGYLVNCARAALVDHAALGAALTAGRIAGCALDVLPDEPPVENEPALRWPRTLLNPHAAWYSPQSADAPYRMAAEAVAAVLAGREPYGALARPAQAAGSA